MKLPAFESLDEKMEIATELHYKTTSHVPTVWAVTNFKSGFNAGVIERDKQWFLAIEQLKAKVLKHKDAYALDIFPNSERLDENSTRDSISARMGRHMCDCFLEYIAEFYSPTQASESQTEDNHGKEKR